MCYLSVTLILEISMNKYDNENIFLELKIIIIIIIVIVIID